VRGEPVDYVSVWSCRVQGRGAAWNS